MYMHTYIYIYTHTHTYLYSGSRPRTSFGECTFDTGVFAFATGGPRAVFDVKHELKKGWNLPDGT